MFATDYQSDDQKILFIMSYIRGSDRVNQWKENYYAKYTDPVTRAFALPPLAQFSTKFDVAFELIEEKQKTNDDLFDIKQDKKSIDDFNIEFDNLVGKTGLDRQQCDPLFVTMYKRAIRPALVTHIINIVPPIVTLTEWMRQASVNENNYNTFIKGRGNDKKKPQWHAKAPNASAVATSKDQNAMEVDRMTTEERRKLQVEGRCFNCKEKGHLSSNCPKRKKKPSKGRMRKADTAEEGTSTAHIEEAEEDTDDDDSDGATAIEEAVNAIRVLKVKNPSFLAQILDDQDFE
ncbi:hypothetical protein WOLCODRAFT_156185 [Wolfiporia cocos MD-104 SS10]|uniref:CCHC-type domain-containing protein n=1 Tax=Wolfiporia cocos (strain MD-104) TaxID=742152 RepID=A0A2H3IZY1_WOLCO|nr:hypothetical protein WOLCODRAFT_156185 [Wolfiporia cocos MD-104 SS10]